MKRLTFVALSVLLLLGMALPALAQGPVLDAAQAYFAGGTKNIKADALYENLHDGDTSNDPLILDTRKAEDFAKAHIPGAVNVSVGALFTAQGLAQLPTDKDIVVVCYTGQTASQVTAALRMLGYKAYNLLYGMAGWTLIEGVVAYPFRAEQSMGYEVSREPATLSGTYALPNPLGETVAAAAEAYFSKGTKNIKADALFENLHDGDQANDPVILDLRKAEDYALGHIPGAVNVPVGKLFTPETLAMLPPDRQIVTYCYTGQTSSQATAALNMLGYDAYSLLFGMPAWAMVEGVSAGPFDASKSMNYAVEGTAAAPAVLPTTGGFVLWPALAALGAAAVGAGVALRRR